MLKDWGAQKQNRYLNELQNQLQLPAVDIKYVSGKPKPKH